MVKFEIYDIKNWIKPNCNTRIAQHPKKLRQPDNEIWSVIDITWEIFFLKNNAQNVVEDLVPDLFIKS